MSIVFITIPGEQKETFARELHERTGNSLEYVIVQKTRKVPILERYQKLLKTVGWKNMLREFYYVLYIRLNNEYRRYLKYFFNWSKRDGITKHSLNIKEVDNVNSEEVYTLLQEIKPKLIVVWGTNVLKSNIFQCGENAINLHMGLGEHYRGSVANHFAVLEKNLDALGAMIHKIDTKTDAGDIYSIVKADTNLPPKELFTKLNDQAYQEYLEIAVKLWKGDVVESVPQNLTKSKNILLREWTPERRYIVAKRLREWEKKGVI